MAATRKRAERGCGFAKAILLLDLAIMYSTVHAFFLSRWCVCTLVWSGLVSSRNHPYRRSQLLRSALASSTLHAARFGYSLGHVRTTLRQHCGSAGERGSPWRQGACACSRHHPRLATASAPASAPDPAQRCPCLHRIPSPPRLSRLGRLWRMTARTTPPPPHRHLGTRTRICACIRVALNASPVACLNALRAIAAVE